MPQATTPAASTPNQGEGNVEAARRYDQAAHEFVAAGKVKKAAHEAKPRSAEEEEQLRAAEQEGMAHAKEEDPAVRKAGRQARAHGTPD